MLKLDTFAGTADLAGETFGVAFDGERLTLSAEVGADRALEVLRALAGEAANAEEAHSPAPKPRKVKKAPKPQVEAEPAPTPAETLAKADPEEPPGSPSPAQVEAAVVAEQKAAEPPKEQPAPPAKEPTSGEHRAPESVLSAKRMTDLVDALANELKLTTIDEMVEYCEGVKADVPILKRASNLRGRVERSAAVLGIAV